MKSKYNPGDVIDNYAPTLTFGGRSFTVSEETCNLGPVEDGSSDCIAGVEGADAVGDVFLQNVYSIYDVGQLRAGFAELA
ncbi:hypothetical protein AZE42_02201 [Rhizopogon vesiculosus]|uniref:Peptidase A1 domain-containing protein n=1 Tax=Rhizopogon vesiculosus TaxID=180088 RepID=A0A1J8Q654_9AGAM|nr:hypothetical protein AZE42_02201 [Rhizopogon vesiculosus]